jgi:hypothetical protein
MATGFIQKVSSLLKERAASSSIGSDRVLIELRDPGLDHLPRLQARLHELAAELPEVVWVEINPFLRRAVFAVDPAWAARTEDADALAELSALVRRVEADVRRDERDERHGRGEHEPAPRPPIYDAPRNGGDVPDDPSLRLRRWVELAADAGGLGLGLILRLVPMVPTATAAQAVFVMSLAQLQPRMR